MQNDDVGKPGDNRADVLADQDLTDARGEWPTNEVSASAARWPDGGGSPKQGPGGLSGEIATLAPLIAEIESCDPQEMRERLHDAISADPAVPDLIVEAVAAVDAEDLFGFLKPVRKIVATTKHAELILSAEGGPAGLSTGLAQLAVLIADIRSRDPQAVLERLRAATATDPMLSAPITEAVASLDSNDPTSVWRHIRRIVNDARLARMILPSRLRPRRPDVVTYRVRIDLRGTKPPLWRRLELASDLHLPQVNKVIQRAFDWSDTELHHFTSGSSPNAPDTEDYLCPRQVNDGRVGIPEHEVRLDEVLVDVQDKLYYVYGYRGMWRLIIRLESILPRDGSTPRAVCTAGRRPSPPDQCDGGVDGYEKIAAATDPASPKNSSFLSPFTPFTMKKMK